MRIVIPLFDRFHRVRRGRPPYEVPGFPPGADAVFVAAEAGPVRNDAGSVVLSASAAFAGIDSPAEAPRPRRISSRRGPADRPHEARAREPSTPEPLNPPTHLGVTA
ncbi:hypothetical protein [Streptosporangium vulgare]|uniref:Uncharacterized protein n=1 Tax=Streptosporangium vulgare TaxID=46190 RepID=A0ABV5TG75_9ACTN